MRRLGIIVATAGLAALAHVGELAAAETASARPACWAGPWDWLNASPADCPLSYKGFTLYGTLDLGYGYQDWGVRSTATSDKLNYGIQKNGYAHVWQPTYGGLSQNVVGLSMEEGLAPLGLPNWSLIGVIEAGVNPYSGMLVNQPNSMTDNNARASNGSSPQMARGISVTTRTRTSIRAGTAHSGTRRLFSGSATRLRHDHLRENQFPRV